MATTSRVFNNGNSQAVRIPQEFRLDTAKVTISRNRNGDLVIRPVYGRKGDAVFEALSDFDEEFALLLEQAREDQPEPQDREPL